MDFEANITVYFRLRWYSIHGGSLRICDSSGEHKKIAKGRRRILVERTRKRNWLASGKATGPLRLKIQGKTRKTRCVPLLFDIRRAHRTVQRGKKHGWKKPSPLRSRVVLSQRPLSTENRTKSRTQDTRNDPAYVSYRLRRAARLYVNEHTHTHTKDKVSSHVTHSITLLMFFFWPVHFGFGLAWTCWIHTLVFNDSSKMNQLFRMCILFTTTNKLPCHVLRALNFLFSRLTLSGGLHPPCFSPFPSVLRNQLGDRDLLCVVMKVNCILFLHLRFAFWSRQYTIKDTVYDFTLFPLANKTYLQNWIRRKEK